MTSFYRIGSKWMIALLAIVMLVAVGCSSDDDNGTEPPANNAHAASAVCNPNSLGSGGGQVQVTVTANDSDGDALTYSYSAAFGSGLPTSPTSSSSASWTLPANAGTNPAPYTVDITVSDGEGGSVTVSAGVTVEGQQQQSGATISGTMSFPPGPSIDLANSQFAIYTSYDNWNFYNPLMATASIGSGASVTYSLSLIPEGSYLLEGWSDRDGDLAWSSGDAVAWYGGGLWGQPNFTFLPVLTGQSYNQNFSMQLIP